MTTPATQGATMTLPPCPIAGHDNPHHWHAKNPDLRSLQYPSAPGHTDDCADDTDEFASRCYSAHVPEPTEPAPTGEPCCCNINCGDYCDKCHGAPGEWRCKRHRREFGDMPTPTAPDLEVPPDAPSLVTLPTVDEIADAIHSTYQTNARIELAQATAVLALLESRVPHWVLIEPGAQVKAGTHLLLSKPSGEYVCVIAAKDSELRADPKGGTWYVNPDTIPAEPTPTPAEKLAEALCATYASDGDEPAWTPADVLAALDAAGLTLAERGEK